MRLLGFLLVTAAAATPFVFNDYWRTAPLAPCAVMEAGGICAVPFFDNTTHRDRLHMRAPWALLDTTHRVRDRERDPLVLLDTALRAIEEDLRNRPYMRDAHRIFDDAWAAHRNRVFRAAVTSDNEWNEMMRRSTVEPGGW